MSQPTTMQRLLPVFIGVFLTGVFLIALAWLADQRRNAAPGAPAIEVVSPAPGAVVDSPLIVRFKTAAPVRLGAAGWGTDQLHLHARVSGIEHMPAAADIRQEGDAFVWTLTGVPPGRHEIRLGWADLAHRELRAGASPTIPLTVR